MRIWRFLQYLGSMRANEENTACSEWKYTFKRNSKGNQEGKCARGRGVGALLLLLLLLIVNAHLYSTSSWQIQKHIFCREMSGSIAGHPAYPLNFYFLEGTESIPYKKAWNFEDVWKGCEVRSISFSRQRLLPPLE